MSWWNPVDVARRALSLGRSASAATAPAAPSSPAKDAPAAGAARDTSSFDAGGQHTGSLWTRFAHAVERTGVALGDDALRTLQNLSADVRQRSLHPTLGKPNPAAGVGKPPVILLGGQGDDANKSMKVLEASLQRDGFQVFVFADPGRAFEGHADASKRLDQLVEQVRKQTGAAKVDLVGYSTGGTNARAYVNLFGGADKVDRVVQLAGSNNGDPGAFGFCQSGVEEKQGSAFMTALNAHPAQVPVYSIYEQGTDGEVQEADAKLPPGPFSHDLPLPQAKPGGGSLLSSDHASLPYDERAYEAMLGALTK